jgi:NitT/TauT family transport system permease protein
VNSAFLIAVVRLALLGVFCAAWEWISIKGIVNPIFIGRPTLIARFLFEGLFINGELLVHAWWTLVATAAAFALGSVMGILFGFLFVTYPLLEKLLDPVFDGLNALPRIALAPLFLLWFGLGLASKIALGFSLTFFIVLSSTIAGARGVNTDFLVLARTLGTTPMTVFRKITLPSAVPSIFSGLRLGLIYALLGVIAGEIIAAEKGLGQLLSFLAGSFKTNGVFAVLLLLALMGSLLTKIASTVEARLLRWR